VRSTRRPGPPAGGTFANTLSNFDNDHEHMTARVAYSPGLKASVSVLGRLILTEGLNIYTFNPRRAASATLCGEQRRPWRDDDHPADRRGFAQAAAGFAPAAGEPDARLRRGRPPRSLIAAVGFRPG